MTDGSAGQAGLMDGAGGSQNRAAPALLPAWTGDLAAAVVMIGTQFVPAPGIPDDGAPLRYDLIVVLWALLIPLRHRHPRLMLGLCLACFAVAAMTFPISPFAALPGAIGVYTIAVREDRRTSFVAAVLVAALTVPLTVASAGSVVDPLVFLVLVMTGFAAVAGESVRVRRAYVAEITARAVRAEQTREAEASRRVAEDRLRIARDLHDAVAHQITVISLHAGVASASLEGRPDAARESLQTIREAARRVLGEIGDLLATLRSSDDAEQPVQTPGLAHLTSLVEGFRSSGLDVTSHVDGDVGALSSAADVVAYRVIQEGLTNALRHGSGPVRVSISIGPENTDLLIVNPVAARPDHGRMGSGHGLAGISERVASVRGHTRHGTDDGTFRLAVTFPTSHRTPPESW
jgi:signal transduction histidine kinase